MELDSVVEETVTGLCLNHKWPQFGEFAWALLLFLFSTPNNEFFRCHNEIFFCVFKTMTLLETGCYTIISCLQRKGKLLNIYFDIILLFEPITVKVRI